MLRQINGGVWIEQAWRPSRQRQYDSPIMESFAQHPSITPLMLVLANKLRMWWGVIFISELADIGGRYIPKERIRNDSEWRATPKEGMTWPNTITPTDRHRTVFRKCFRLTFCTGMSPYGAVQDYDLDTPLGKWYPVKRYIQFPAYRLKTHILVREERGLHKATPLSKSGFFDISEEIVTKIPLKAQPINPNYSSSVQLWTQKPRILVRSKLPIIPLQILEENLNPDQE